MSESIDLEHCIQNLSCGDDTDYPQQEIDQQKLVIHLRQQLAQQQLANKQQQQQLEQQQQQLEQQQLEISQQKWKIEQLQSPSQNVKPNVEQQKPFQIVLIDIKQAARKNICCVEKPLMGDEDFKYVALSYRWGELNETTVDTGLDYIATVTSFRLADLFALCEAMTKETDLQHMDYVWVDAICVDQKNYERRKATIYQMTNIYNKANYIVAVPDLHLQHHITTSVFHYDNYEYITDHNEFIFQLVHGNVDQLINDNENNNDEGNPTTIISEEQLSNAIQILLDLMKDWTTRVWVVSEYSIAKTKNVMKFWFIQLNRDYGLGIQDPEIGSFYYNNFSFFEFDFNRTSPSKLQIDIFTTDNDDTKQWKNQFMGRYNHFHSRLFFYLGEKQFLETILKSKASKNEDRFHAVLPLSKYKHIIENKDKVESWKITDLISNKLRLFEFMDTYDKLLLFFLSGNVFALGPSSRVLPTFATSNTFFPLEIKSYFQLCDSATGLNFDLSNESTITLKPTSHGGGGYKLNIKPMQYFKGYGESLEILVYEFWKKQNRSGKRLGLDECLQVVYIPIFQFESVDGFVNEYYENENNDQAQYILLIGNYDKNIWVLHRDYELYLDTDEMEMGDSFGTDIGFDVY